MYLNDNVYIDNYINIISSYLSVLSTTLPALVSANLNPAASIRPWRAVMLRHILSFDTAPQRLKKSSLTYVN